MKRLITLLIVLACFALCVEGQSVIRSSVGAAGSSQLVTVNNKTYYVSQSVGQASVIGTSSNNGHTIRQGYQQPPYQLIVDRPLTTQGLETTIYPNPFSHTLKIAFKDEIDKDVSILLFDISGKIVFTRSYQPAQLITLYLETISHGEYILHVSSGQKNMITTIIKK